MSAFIHTKTVLAGMATDITGVASLAPGLKVIAEAMTKNEEKAELGRTQRAGLILGGTPLACTAMTIAGKNGEKVKAATYADMMGIKRGTFSQSRSVWSVALHMSGLVVDGDAAVNQSAEKMTEQSARLVAWWSERFAHDPAAATLTEVFDWYTSDDGETRLQAVQKLQETFGSIAKIYTIMNESPADDENGDGDGEDDGEDDGEGATTWQGMLGRAIDAARAQGATPSEVIFLVRKLQNDEDSREA